MSYCVNCGVKLDSSLTKCPLCNTPVLNPNELSKDYLSAPFANEKGQPEAVAKKDFGVLLSVVLSATALSCGLLNAFVLTKSLWSLFIIGICIILWVFAVPFIIYTRLPIYFSLLFDGIAVDAFLYMISYVTPNKNWFFHLGFPITTLVTFLLIILAFLRHHVSSSILATGLYIFLEVPTLCIGIELLLRHFAGIPLRMSWSAIVLTVCAVISIILITILSKKRLRSAVRRRLHF